MQFERKYLEQQKLHRKQSFQYGKRLDKFEEFLLAGNRNQENSSFSPDVIVNAMAELNYMPEEEVTFTSYFRRYKDLFITDCADWSDHKKVRLLLRKLGAVEYTKFVNYILPRKQAT